jgi:hypothetical protein
MLHKTDFGRQSLHQFEKPLAFVANSTSGNTRFQEVPQHCAATIMKFCTGASNTTATGTEIRIDSDQQVSIAPLEQINLQTDVQTDVSQLHMQAVLQRWQYCRQVWNEVQEG